jgi:GMP synthase (glutamine-hydrolysing)
MSTAEVRPRISVLFLNVQERRFVSDLGLPPYREWIAAVMRVPSSDVTVINVADGEPLPDTIEASAVIGGGSVHSAYEDLPWIRQAKQFFLQTQRQGIPQLHICWSHQAMAEAAGGTVTPGHDGRRFGVERLHLTGRGRADPLFRGLPDSFEIFTSHMDTIRDVPVTDQLGQPITELAYSDGYRFEALRYGQTCWTIQAHPELTSDIVAAYGAYRRANLIEEGFIGPDNEDFEEFLLNVKLRNDEIIHNSQRLLANWSQFVISSET